MIDLFIELRHGTDQQIHNHQYRRFNLTTRYDTHHFLTIKII
jgi:hypothetical protein